LGHRVQSLCGLGFRILHSCQPDTTRDLATSMVQEDLWKEVPERSEIGDSVFAV
ncbi:hypothetical protein HDV05_001224, partial [Chytridiales sp. JEL 0842]